MELTNNEKALIKVYNGEPCGSDDKRMALAFEKFSGNRFANLKGGGTIFDCGAVKYRIIYRINLIKKLTTHLNNRGLELAKSDIEYLCQEDSNRPRNNNKNQETKMNTQITFDQLPEAVALLLRKVEGIEQRLEAMASQSKPEQDELLTIHGAAKFLDLQPATIYGKVHRKELPFLKRSQRVYFSKSDLMDWLKKSKEQNNA